MIDIISSLQNEAIKKIISLGKHRIRQEQGLTVVDGEREITMAIGAGWEIPEIFYCPELIKNKTLLSAPAKITAVTEKIFRKIAYKENPDGWLAIIKTKNLNINDLKLPANPLVLILESVEKPGNLGAIIRTAAATGVSAVIVADPQTDIFHPNVIRSSQGHLFQQPISAATSEEIFVWLKKNSLPVYGADTKAKGLYTEVNWQKPAALVLGTEAESLSAKWLSNLTQAIKAPMRDGIDSLNVSVAAAIIVYEAWRQRNFVDF